MIWNMCSRSDVKNNEDINHMNSVKLRPTPFWKLDENAKSDSSNFGYISLMYSFNAAISLKFNKSIRRVVLELFTKFMAHLAEYYFIRLIIKGERQIDGFINNWQSFNWDVRSAIFQLISPPQSRRKKRRPGGILLTYMTKD